MSPAKLTILLLTLSVVILETTAIAGNSCGKNTTAPKGQNSWAAADCKDGCLNYDIKLKFVLKAASCVKSLIGDLATNITVAIDKAAKTAPKIVQCLLEKLKCMDSSKKGKVDKKKVTDLCTILTDKAKQTKCTTVVGKCVDKNYKAMTSDANSYKPFIKCAVQQIDSICPKLIPPEVLNKYLK